MSQNEYDAHWREAQWRVFQRDKRIPDRIFHEGFQLAFYEYPIHFDEAFYATLQEVLAELGENRFAVVGEPRSAPKGQSRFVYPASLGWPELTEGEGIEQFHHHYSDEYYLFGERGDWELYSFTVEFGLIIAGFKASAAAAFEGRFIRDKEEVARNASDVLELTSDDFARRFRENYLTEEGTETG